MNLLLIYPKYPDTFWSYKHILKFVSKKAAFPPLGLLTVASMLPEKWKKRIIDMNVRTLRDKDIEWADMVFISGMVVQRESAKEVIARCKGKKVVCGGPLFTTGYEDFKGVDHFVLNEGEVTLPLFLKDLKKGKAKHIYQSGERPNITKTPVPSWHLINLKDYVSMGVQYSRGCPFNCEFCDIIIMNGRIPRTKTTRQILDEFDSLYYSGWRGPVLIVDDNFIGNKAEIKKMLPEMIKWQKKHKYPFTLSTEASVNLADDKELLRMMNAANFYKVFLGIETTNLDSLKECAKFQNTKSDLAEAVRTIQEHGMQVVGGFIVGFDNDVESIFEAQIKFIQKTGIVTAMVGLLNALPQTRLWNRLKAEKRLVCDHSGENTDGSINFVPKMGKEALLEGYKKMISRIYSPKYYYKRTDILMKNFRPRFKSRISFSEFKAVLKSVWSVGIKSKARMYYWKLMLKTSLTNRRALPVAIELAISRQHFEKVAKKIVNNA